MRYFEANQPIEGFDDDILESDLPHHRPPASREFLPVHSASENNSSEEDDEEATQETFTHRNQTPINTPGKYGSPIPRTFVPRLDTNTFQLTKDELRSLQLPPETIDSSGTLILLPIGESLTFVGTASVTLLHGTINLLGTPLRPSLRCHRVYSPRSSPLASLEAVKLEVSFTEEDFVSFLSPRDSTGRILPQRVQNAMLDSHSVIIIQPLHTGIKGLGKICPTFDSVFDVNSDIREREADVAIGVGGFYMVDPISRPHPQIQPFFLPESWSRALDAVAPLLPPSEDAIHSLTIKPFVGLVRGPKKCGKSTFARTLLNRLISRYRQVAFLDCDLGQSEFSPGGMVSLHVISNPVFGPSFTHPTLPYRAHYVGHTTPRSSPAYYLSCIQALMQTYLMDVQYAYQETLIDGFSDQEETEVKTKEVRDNRSEMFIPLVVNTQGWIKGLGGDLLRNIEEIVEATAIFDMDVQSGAFPRQQAQPPSARLYTIRPILNSPLATYYTPTDYRSLSILSYFHCHFPSRGDDGVRAWTTDLPLCARQPWEVNCLEAIDLIVLFGAGFEDVVPEELDRAINCGVVALVCDEDLRMDPPDPKFDSLWPYTQGVSAPSPTTSYCAGLAIVRGVDVMTRTLHLLTPLPPAVFSKCRVLVKGELELPIWGMLDYREGFAEGVAGVKWEKVPYLQMGSRDSKAVGGTRRRIRRNLMRRGQM
ncbi:hypothetical protein K439DRAFT_1330498 [Ramaria rubella]|nr:hypothetical protein K439DRAFT_1330498 [Ramaria rubella]